MPSTKDTLTTASITGPRAFTCEDQRPLDTVCFYTDDMAEASLSAQSFWPSINVILLKMGQDSKVLTTMIWRERDGLSSLSSSL